MPQNRRRRKYYIRRNGGRLLHPGSSTRRRKQPLFTSRAEDVQDVFNFAGNSNSGLDTRIELPTGLSISRTGSYSCSVWIRSNGDPSPNAGTIFEYAPSSSNRNSFRLLAGSGGGSFGYVTYNGSSYTAIKTDRGKFNDGNWHNAILVVDSGVASIYANGRLQDTSSITGGGINLGTRIIGHQLQGEIPSQIRLNDFRIYDRVLSASECLSIYRKGRSTDVSNSTINDYELRYHPKTISNTDVIDLSGNGNTGLLLNWNDEVVEQDLIYPFASIFSVGNSLTVDSVPELILPRSDRTISESQPLSFHAANPFSATNAQSYNWGEALRDEEYDVIMVQPFPENPVQTIESDIGHIKTIIGDHPCKMIVIHEGFGNINSIRRSIDNPLTENFEYSTTCFEKYVQRVQEEYPSKIVVRTKTNEAFYQVERDIKDGVAVGFDGLGNPYSSSTLYRDSIHANLTSGRYLINHCVRKAIGYEVKNKSYPFINHPIYTDTNQATMDYLDTVVNRVHKEKITPRVITSPANSVNFSNSSRVSTTTNYVLNNSQNLAFTVLCWVRVNQSLADETREIIWSWGATTHSNRIIWLEANHNSNNTYNLKLFFANTSFNNYSSDTELNVGEWYRVGYVERDNYNERDIYINGELDTSIDDTRSRQSMGSFSIGGTVDTTPAYANDIDIVDVQVYNKEGTVDDISNDYKDLGNLLTYGLGSVLTTADLEIYWPLNEVTGSTFIADLGQLSQNGTIEGNLGFEIQQSVQPNPFQPRVF